jgi:hypothetical protein
MASSHSATTSQAYQPGSYLSAPGFSWTPGLEGTSCVLKEVFQISALMGFSFRLFVRSSAGTWSRRRLGEQGPNLFTLDFSQIDRTAPSGIRRKVTESPIGC